MWKHSPYEARTETERQRHLARLGTRWQQNRTPERRSAWQEQMDIWRAREAYRAEGLLWVLGMIAVGLLAMWLSGCHALDCAVAHMHGYLCDPVAPVACTPESRAQGYCKDVPLAAWEKGR